MLRAILRIRSRETTAEPPEHEQGETHEAAVLVLTTDERTRSTVSLLTAEGYAVHRSTNIQEACTLLRAEHDFDLVVLECANAATTAVVTCEQLKEAAQGMPILVLVEVADVPERVSILDAGATFVLEGGYAPAELLARLRVLVRRRGREQRSTATATAAPAPELAATTMPPRGAAWRFALSAALLVLTVDIATKMVVETSLPAAERLRPLPFLSLVHAHGSSSHAILAFALLIAVPLFAAARAVAAASSPVPRPRTSLLGPVALGTFAAGALGNLAQLVVIGSVTDFVALSHLPALNVADTLAVAALLILLGSAAVNAARRH